MKQFSLPNFPYAIDALEPVLSKETLEYSLANTTLPTLPT